MVLNIILVVAVIGWTINAATFQGRGKLALSLLNAALAIAAALWLLVRVG